MKNDNEIKLLLHFLTINRSKTFVIFFRINEILTELKLENGFSYIKLYNLKPKLETRSKLPAKLYY